MYLIWNGIILRIATNQINERPPTDFLDQTQLELLFSTSSQMKDKIFYLGTDVNLEVDGNERTATMRLRTKNEKWKQKNQPSVLCQRATSSGSSDLYIYVFSGENVMAKGEK